MTVDLHVHTRASDGTLRPRDVVSAALDLDLRVIAITDHDTVDGIQEALEAAAGTGLEVLPGVELSVTMSSGPDPHILGYLIDHRRPRLVTTLRTLREARLERATRMVEMLAAGGHPVTLDDVMGHAGDAAVGRSHVARALVDSGAVGSIEEAFRDLIGHGAPFYVGKEVLTGAQAIRLIHDAGGVAVVAHPGVTGESSLLELIEAGLDGIEAYHAEHSEPQRRHFASEASRFGLAVTGGSDFHGPGMRNSSLGSGGCPEDAVEDLRRRATIVRP